MTNSRTLEWKENLDTKEYLNTFFCKKKFNDDFISGMVQAFHEVMNDGTFTGRKCLDFGCGSVIAWTISASRYFDEIYFADFPKNIQEVQNWIDRGEDAMDWSYFFEENARLEGTSPQAVESRLRSKIAGTIAYTTSLLDNQPPDPQFEQQFDFVILDNVLHAICSSMDDYTRCLNKLKTYIKPGGHICINDPLGETFSLVGNKKFEMFPLSYGGVIKSFEEAELQIVKSFKKSFTNDAKRFYDSCQWHMNIAHC